VIFINAIYAGSFDPFTNGHLDIIKQACSIFSNVFVVVSENSSKTKKYNSDMMCAAIVATLNNNGIHNINVLKSNGLIADLAILYNCDYLIRGLRNPNDYNYEENIAKINLEINENLKTIYFRADNEVISSSFVKELYAHNKDVSKYVSKDVLKIMYEGKLNEH
jgi:pantetheine-phosphate adenylyltransferase